MKFTGERFVPERVPEQMILEHLHRYHLAAKLVKGKKVLDAACGAGYGSAILARSAEQVTGLDLSAETIAYASERYRAVSNVRYVQGSIAELPFPDDSFDVVVSFETLEHVPQELQYEFRSEIERVLRPGGRLVMSSPDKHTYSELLHFDNEFHVHELYAREFELFLQEVFPHAVFYRQGVNDFYLSAVRSTLPGQHAADASDFVYDADKELYILAVASKEPMEDLPDLTSFMSRRKDPVPRLYADCGDGFREDTIVYGKVEAAGDGFRAEFLLGDYEGIRALRFDPVDGTAARVTLRSVQADGKAALWHAMNAELEQDGVCTFYTPDCNYLLDGDFSACETLVIEYKLEILDQQFVYTHQVLPLRAEIVAVRAETEQAKQEIVRAQQETEKYHAALDLMAADRDHLAGELDLMRHTRGWRLLERLRRMYHRVLPPESLRYRALRFFYRLVRHMTFHRALRGLQCLLSDGPRVFWHRLRLSLRPGSAVEDRDRYHDWILDNEPDEAELEAQRRRVFAYAPLISVVVPTYNTPEVYLRELVDSLAAQTYANWELCIADGASENAAQIQQILASYEDERIHCQLLTDNRKISGNTNAAIAMAQGDFVAFADHDDVLAPFAFYEVVSVLQDKAQPVDYIYSDEDKFETIGERYMPHFKPDFALDTLRSYNYISHLSVLRRSLLERIGGLDDALDGSQDYDITLRAVEQTEHVVHIPKILYHWRVHQGSVSVNQSSKMYAFEAGRKAIENHLQRMHVPATVIQGNFLGSYRVVYDLPRKPLVSIVIPNMEQEESLRRAIDSILQRSTYPEYEIILVENNSKSDGIFAYYQELEQAANIRVVRWEGKGFNFSSLVNFGVRHAQGEYVLLLNNDVEVITPEWLENMVMFAQREDVGAVGARLYYPNDTIQHAGVFLHPDIAAAHSFRQQSRFTAGYFGRLQVVQDVSAVTGACLMVRRALYDAVGGLDEKNFTVDYNDIDFCLKLRELGKVNVFNPWVELYHYESISRGGLEDERNRTRWSKERANFLRRWSKFIDGRDPYFHYFLIDD